MFQAITNTAFQILIFALVPFLVYVISKRRITGIFDYVGLKRSTARANGLAFLLALVFLVPSLGLAIFSQDFMAILTAPETMTGKFRAMELNGTTLVILLLDATLKTAFAEELLFRGFLAKRLIAVMGYRRGNLSQAIFFGLIHFLFFLKTTYDPLFLIFILVFPTLGAYLTVILNERLANGSILPGWIAHGTANVISYLAIGFLI